MFGGLTALAVAASLAWLIRKRPPFRPDPQRNQWRARYLRIEKRLRTWIVLVVAGYLGIKIGSRAAAQWQTYLLWRHAKPWGQTDPYFHRDISYYVADLPFHQLVVSLLSSILVTCLVVSLVASYLYGAIRIRGRGRKMTPAFKSQLSLLVGLWLLVKAAGFWLSRYALTTSPRGLVTGMGYTDTHATLPGRTILAVIALLAGLLVLANIWLKRLRYLVLGVVTVVVASLVLGLAWPALVYRFKEQPSAASLDRTEIENNQAATLSAFGLDGTVTTQEYGASTSAPTTPASVERTAQVRLLDPNVVSPTFNVKQALQSYYLFKSTLDMGTYPLGSGTDNVANGPQDVAIAARELNLQGIPRSSWTNRHLVYTHGYGVVAAPTDQVDSQSGTPTFVNGGLPPQNQIPVGAAPHLLRSELPQLLHRRAARRQHRERRVRPPEPGRRPARCPDDLRGRRRRPDRLDADPAALRDPAARPQHLLLGRHQQRVPAADRAQPPDPRGAGRALADPRR